MDISCQRNDPHVPILIIYLLVKCKANGPALVQDYFTEYKVQSYCEVE